MFTCWVQHHWVTELNCSLQYFLSPLFIFVSLKCHIDNTANIPCSYFFPPNWKMQLPPVHKLFFCSCIQTITLHAGIRWQWQKQPWWYCFYFFLLKQRCDIILTEVNETPFLLTWWKKNVSSNFLTCLTDPSKFVHLSTKLICSSRQRGSFWHCTQTVQQQVTRHFLATSLSPSHGCNGLPYICILETMEHCCRAALGGDVAKSESQRSEKGFCERKTVQGSTPRQLSFLTAFSFVREAHKSL